MSPEIVKASLPWLGAVEHMGGPLPPNIELVEWNSPEPSEALADVEFVVPPFGFSSSPGALGRLPRLRVVQTLTAGVDWILREIPPGVTLCDARGVHDTSTAEWTVAAMLAAVRELPLFARTQAEGRWAYRATDELAGKRVLIVGYGSIGAAIERRLAGFEVEVLRVARSARDGVASANDLPTLLPQADVVVLVVPLTAQTRGMVDADFLARMHDGALLVNVARGPVVDTDALLAELTTGRLRAALDVTDPEPLPEGHPLWSAPGCFITPHVGGSTSGLNDRAWRFVRAQLERYAAGRPLENVVEGDY